MRSLPTAAAVRACVRSRGREAAAGQGRAVHALVLAFRAAEVAHKQAGWLHNLCRLGGVGSPTLQSAGQNQRWPTSGPGFYMTRADRGVPYASDLGTK